MNGNVYFIEFEICVDSVANTQDELHKQKAKIGRTMSTNASEAVLEDFDSDDDMSEGRT